MREQEIKSNYVMTSAFPIRIGLVPERARRAGKVMDNAHSAQCPERINRTFLTLLKIHDRNEWEITNSMQSAPS